MLKTILRILLVFVAAFVLLQFNTKTANACICPGVLVTDSCGTWNYGTCNTECSGVSCYGCNCVCGYQGNGTCNGGTQPCANGYCYTADAGLFVRANNCQSCTNAGYNFEWCTQNGNSINCQWDSRGCTNDDSVSGVNCAQNRCELQTAQTNCNQISGCLWVDTTNQCYNSTCSSTTSTCTNKCGSTIGCTPPCTPSNPQSITNPSPTGANQPLSVTLNTSYNSSTFNWGTKCPAPNSDSFTFYLDQNTNPTTQLTCPNNGPSSTPSSLTGTCAVSGLSNNTTYYWKVTASNGGSSTNSGPWGFTTQNASAWWQVKDADVITNGAIQSTIPSAGLYFGLNGLGGYHGIPTYGTTASFGSGTVSTAPAWSANVSTSYKKSYNYAFFKSQIPSSILTDANFELTKSTITNTDLTSGGTSSRGYYWYHYDPTKNGGADLTISGNISLGSRKVILLVEGANLNINGQINLSKGSGFFMAAVTGNINIGSTITGSPSLEGIYYADGTISTGAGTSQLYVRGSVAASGGVTLQRNLGSGNSTTPGEVFEYAPDLMVLYPNIFTDRRILWKEVAP